jgi:DNA-binding CsgD family transcriptional regulator
MTRNGSTRPRWTSWRSSRGDWPTTPWLEAATHEQRAAGVRSDSSPADALSGLSPSERQVVLLAAEGLTNPEIAARLFVSPRTVGSHLYRSFTKLGVSNRNQLAAVVQSSRL